MRTYYLQYQEDTSINYLYLLLLNKIAELDKSSRLYNTVRFSSLDELTKRLNDKYNQIHQESKKNVISKTTLIRVLNNEQNKRYFSYDKEKKLITLHNDFKNKTTNKKAKFITLTDREIDFLLIQKNELLIRYYLFIKYNCGFSGRNKADFTATQFLEATNYCSSSGSNKNKLSSFNGLLVSNKFISIQKFRYNGKERNAYSIL